jgi:hypothetical protein
MWKPCHVPIEPFQMMTREYAGHALLVPLAILIAINASHGKTQDVFSVVSVGLMILLTVSVIRSVVRVGQEIGCVLQWFLSH